MVRAQTGGRMRALRFAKWSMVLVAVLIAAAAVIVLSTDFGAYKGYAEEAVRNATGRKLVFDGPVKLELLPAPSLVAEKLRFANAPWGSRPDMATVDRVEVRIALLPLVSGKVVFSRLVFDRLDILIETDKAGLGNWKMGAAQPASTPASGAPAIPVLDDVMVRNARLTYRQGRTGASDTLTLETLHIKGAGGGAPLDVALKGDVNSQTFALNGRVAPSGADTWTVANLQASFGKTQLNGNVTINFNAAPPRLIAKLDSPEIDLASFATAKPGNAPARPGGGRMFPDAQMPLDALHALDADISLTAKRVLSGKLAIEDTNVGLTLKGGKLTVRPFTASLAGGAIDGMATLDGAGILAARATAKDIDANRLLAALGMPDALAGKASLDVRLAGRGRTLHDVMASLDGTFGVVLGKGTIGSRYVDLLGADVVRTLLPGGNIGNATPLNCAAAPFIVEKGIAKTDAILFDTDRMTVHGGGTVNLRDETLDFLLKPQPKDAALISLATPIRVAGTLASPTAYPDPGGVVRDIAGAVAGMAALGPFGLLLPLVSGGTEEQSHCIAAMLKGDGKATPAAPKDKGPTGVLQDLGSGIEKGIRGLFGR